MNTDNEATMTDRDAVKRRTAWMYEGKLGLTTHYFPKKPEEVEEVTNAFDVERVAEQCKQAGAAWFMLTLHHQPWLMQAPNSTLDRLTGTDTYTASRDLPADLHQALSARGIHMMLYLNLRIDPEGACLPPIKRALGPCPPEDETIDRVAEVYREFAERYGSKVVGWWVDGVWRPEFMEQPDERRERWFATLADALRAGNPDAAIAFNPGVPDALMRYTPQNDFLAGEANNMREPPTDRFLEGAQWHVWPHLGQWWGSGGMQFPTQPLCRWAKRVVAADGVLSFDVGTRGMTSIGQGHGAPVANFTPGAIDPVQVAQIRCVSDALRDGS